MFRCAYGACTKISSICNGVHDCVDLSDEPPNHSCRVNNVPVSLPNEEHGSTTKRYTPYPSLNHQSTVIAESTTKHYTPFTFSTSSQRPTHTTSTTKRYTPYPSWSSTARPTTNTPSSTKIYTPLTVATKPQTTERATSESATKTYTPQSTETSSG
jgi:hypothetical protein